MRILTLYNNEIINIAYPSLVEGNDPPEGLIDPTTNTSIVYVDHLDGLPEYLYMATRFWDGGRIQIREARPNEFFYWDAPNWILNTSLYLDEVRRIRNGKLADCDWTQIEDAPISAEKKLEYQTYRQALRDMTIPIQENPQLYTKIEDAPWPTPPA